VDGAHIGARDDLKIGVLPAVDRSLDLLHHLADRYDIFSSKVTALLGKNLILDLDAGRAGALTASAVATQPRPTPFKAKEPMLGSLGEQRQCLLYFVLSTRGVVRQRRWSLEPVSR
jgi:hypothetical protein